MNATHRRLEQLPVAECWELLTHAEVGRVAMVSAGRLEIVPVNFLIDGFTLLFRTSVSSMLAHAAAHSAPLVMEADRLEPALRVGWSVVVHGYGALCADEPELAELPWPTDLAGGKVVVRLTPTMVSGRRIAPGVNVSVG
jgi:nitroimidazol reductase NimA-like FMN-containing flavoprotein (pyridoxamine 5'-phosphate oxidase superfamily)